MLILIPWYRKYTSCALIIFTFIFPLLLHTDANIVSCPLPSDVGPILVASSLLVAHQAAVEEIVRTEYNLWGYNSPYQLPISTLLHHPANRPIYIARHRHSLHGCPYAKQLVVQKTGSGKSALVHSLVGLLQGAALIISPLLVLGNHLAKKVLSVLFPPHIGPVNVVILDDYNTPSRAALAHEHVMSLPTADEGRAATIIIASPQCIASEQTSHLRHAQLIIDLHQRGCLSSARVCPGRIHRPPVPGRYR